MSGSRFAQAMTTSARAAPRRQEGGAEVAGYGPETREAFPVQSKVSHCFSAAALLSESPWSARPLMESVWCSQCGTPGRAPAPGTPPLR